MPPPFHPKQHDGPQKQRRHPRQGEQPVAGDLKLQNEKDEGQQDQEDADKIDGQGLKGEKGQQQADGADHPGQHHAGVGQFKVDAGQADHHQDEGDVGVGDIFQDADGAGPRGFL